MALKELCLEASLVAKVSLRFLYHKEGIQFVDCDALIVSWVPLFHGLEVETHP